MCRSPVTLGSGSIITKVFSPADGCDAGVKNPESSHHSYSSVSMTDGRKFFSLKSSTAAGGFCGITSPFDRLNGGPCPHSRFAKQKAPLVPGRTAPWYHLGFAHPLMRLTTSI